MTKTLSVFAITLLLASPAWAQDHLATGSYAIVIGQYADVMGSCSIALGDHATVEGNNLIVIAGQPARPIYEITPKIEALIRAEVAKIASIEPETTRANAAMSIGLHGEVVDWIGQVIVRWNTACGAHVS